MNASVAAGPFERFLTDSSLRPPPKCGAARPTSRNRRESGRARDTSRHGPATGPRCRGGGLRGRLNRAKGRRVATWGKLIDSAPPQLVRNRRAGFGGDRVPGQMIAVAPVQSRDFKREPQCRCVGIVAVPAASRPTVPIAVRGEGGTEDSARPHGYAFARTAEHDQTIAAGQGQKRELSAAQEPMSWEALATFRSRARNGLHCRGSVGRSSRTHRPRRPFRRRPRRLRAGCAVTGRRHRSAKSMRPPPDHRRRRPHDCRSCRRASSSLPRRASDSLSKRRYGRREGSE
jgi:hypothetical protein